MTPLRVKALLDLLGEPITHQAINWSEETHSDVPVLRHGAAPRNPRPWTRLVECSCEMMALGV